VLAPTGRLYGKGAMWARNAAPGDFFQYNNFAWGVLGGVMEKAAGERFDVLMQKLLFGPMGIVGSFHPYTLAASDRENVATLYRKRIEKDGREIWQPDGPWVPQVDDYSVTPPEPRVLPGYDLGSNGTLCGPQGNCRLSAESLGAIMLMLMNGGEHVVDGVARRILKRESVDLMLAQQWRYAPGKNGAPGNGANAFGTHRDLMNAWGLGNQHFLDISGPNSGDRLVEGGGYRAVGHLGDAWGLTSAFVFNRQARSGMVYLIGGPGSNPEGNPGKFSGLYRHEEEILSALYEVIRP
jgi:CubicO group peptidase (beta-lactamase class C family)